MVAGDSIMPVQVLDPTLKKTKISNATVSRFTISQIIVSPFPFLILFLSTLDVFDLNSLEIILAP